LKPPLIIKKLNFICNLKIFLAFFFLITIFLIIKPGLILALKKEILISEIAWMGTLESAHQEWLELFNPNPEPINLDGWVLKSSDNSLKINLKGIIKPKEFFLLERKNDNTLPQIKADLIWQGNLSNKGENLALYDKEGSLIDQVFAENGWPAGNNKTKQTMERIIGKNGNREWQTSKEPGGTPKQKNSEGETEKIKTESLSHSFKIPPKENLAAVSKIKTKENPFKKEKFFLKFSVIFLTSLIFGIMISIIFLKIKQKLIK
jgi:hypothetical protein